MSLSLRASASGRWMSCTASATIDVTHLAPGLSDASADLGTALHGVSQRCLLDGSKPSTYIGSVFDSVEISRKAVEEIVAPYVYFVRDKADGFKLLVEKTVEYNEDIGGTPDATILAPDWIHIIDLKTGQKRVETVGNSQLMIYLLAVYRKWECIYDFKKFAITIFQPMANNIVTHWLSLNDLLKFEAELKNVHKRIKLLDVTFVPTESNCYYCPAQTICPALVEKATDMAKLDFIPKKLSGTELATKLELVELLTPMFEALKQEARSRLLSSIKVPGYKLHPGKNYKSWKDDRKAATALRRAGVDGYYTEPVLRSPAQIIELIKLQHVEVDINGLILTTSGEPYLMKDKAPADVDRTEDAVADFAEVTRNAKRTSSRKK